MVAVCMLGPNQVCGAILQDNLQEGNPFVGLLFQITWINGN